MSKMQWGTWLLSVNPEQRRQILADRYQFSQAERELLDQHTSDLGNDLVENYITDYPLPEGVVTKPIS